MKIKVNNEKRAMEIIEELEKMGCGIITACYSSGYLELLVRDENKAKVIISYLL